MTRLKVECKYEGRRNKVWCVEYDADILDKGYIAGRVFEENPAAVSIEISNVEPAVWED